VNERMLRSLFLTVTLACMVLSRIGVVNAESPARREPSTGTDDSESIAAFESLVPVLRHPRCVNCHSTGDFPRQGDDSHRHTMQVRRGPDGEGAEPVECNSCHQDYNLAEVHTPPGRRVGTSLPLKCR
jgi:hypothetical protein